MPNILHALRPCNAAGTFQKAMDVIFPSVEWQFALAHLDDIIIFHDLQTSISLIFALYCCYHQGQASH